MPHTTASRSQTTVATLLASAIAVSGLVLDLTTPYAQAGGAAYVALVMPALWLPWRSAPVVLAATGTVLIGAGYAAHAAGTTPWLAIGSRGVAMATVWIAAIAIGQYRRAVARSSRAGHLRALIDATADGVIMIDAQGTVQELNRTGERLFGYTAAEVVGHNVSMLMPSPYREEHDGYLERYRATGVRRVVGTGRTVVGQRKDGTTFPLQLAVGEAHHAGESIFVGTIRDLSEQELAAHELQRAKEVAEEANRAKSLFLANMTHELRTPLNAILGYAQIMDHGATIPTGHRRAVRAILGAGHHLMELVNEVLNLSKIEAGAMELHPTDFSVAELVEDLSDLFAVRCEGKGIGWRVDNGVDAAVVVRGDSGKLRQVLINFLGNAVKFTERGEVVLRLRGDGDDAYRFEVEDTGAGITPEARERIFEPFSQAEEGRDKGGTGLGLTIAKRQVEIMGGELELDSEVGRGSCFAFTLTLPPGEAIATAADRPAWPRVVGLAPGATVEAVVADDVADNRAILSQMLADLGVTVRTAADGGEAVALVAARRPDICFLDIRMPGMDGVAALEAIRARGDGMVCVAVTATGLAHESHEIHAAGFDEVVSKPFYFERIHACLARHLGDRLRYASAAGDNLAQPPLSPAALTLPSPLYDRLATATRLNAFTEIDALLTEVAATGGEGEALAGHLRALLDRYDTGAILATLEHVTHG